MAKSRQLDEKSGIIGIVGALLILFSFMWNFAVGIIVTIIILLVLVLRRLFSC